MVNAVLAFQLHQPFRLRRYSIFETSNAYFDDVANGEICRRVAQRSYLPALQALSAAADDGGDGVKFAFIASGTVIEQLLEHAPAVVEAMQRLCDAGVAEMVATPYHHALALPHGRDELLEQLNLHLMMCRERFGQTPAVMANTMLSYDDAVAAEAAALGFAGIIADLGEQGGPAGPATVYAAATTRPLAVLPRQVSLSDDLAWRMGDPSWPHHPLSARTFAGWMAGVPGELALLSLDLATFGEHQDAAAGSLGLLRQLPAALAEHGVRMTSASHAATLPAGPPLSVSQSSAAANPMQAHAAQELWALEEPIKLSGDEALLQDWRRLTTSDHLSYMSTRLNPDAPVFKPFSPYDSPYDGYINVMNVVDNLKKRLSATPVDVDPAEPIPAPRAFGSRAVEPHPRRTPPMGRGVDSTFRQARSPLQHLMAAATRPASRAG